MDLNPSEFGEERDHAPETDSGTGPEPAPARRPRSTKRDLEDRIRRYNSDLEPWSLTFKAAVILLAGCEYGHNIELLSRRTGYERSFVARVARRLIDNGIWSGGETLADWAAANEAAGTFWNDVAVAEGKMCRRTAPDGSTEWAPAGVWNKNFQFVDHDAEGSLATRYLDASTEARPPVQDAAESPAETAHIPAADDAAEPATTSSAEAGTILETDTGKTPPPEPTGDFETEIVGPVPGPPAAPSTTTSPTVPSLDELFDNVVWIG